jgi:hypothetical protein
MKRALILTPIVLVVAVIAMFLSGYGIRVGRTPCTYFAGIVTIGNYERQDCPRFGKVIIAIP